MRGHRKSILMLASVSLAACASAEFRPRAVGNSFTSASSAEQLIAEGRAQFHGGNFALAIGSFRRALRQDPRSLDAYNGLAASYDRLGRFDLARRYYEEGLALAPADPRLRHNLAVSLRMQGLEREAAQLETETARLAGAAQAAESALEQPEPVAAEPVLPPRQALADRGPSDSVTIVLPPPAPMRAPRVEQALPRLERISTAEVELVTRPEPARAEAPREARVEARPLPVRTVRDTTREVVIRIGEPEPVLQPVPAAPARAAAPVAVAHRQAPVVAHASPQPAIWADAAPARASNPPALPRNAIVTTAAAPAPRPATPPMVAPSLQPARPAIAMAARVTGTVTAVAPAPAPAVPTPNPVAPTPIPVAPPAAVPSPQPAQAITVARRATGTVTAAAFAPAPAGPPAKVTRASQPARPTLTHYPAYTPLIRVARSEQWRPLDRASRLAWTSLERPAPLVALAQYRSPMRILNAVGRRGQAARMQAHLREFGWAQSSIGDARSRRFRSILLTPPGTMLQARAIAATLPFPVRLVPTAANRPLMLVLGRNALTFDDRLRREATRT